MSNPSKSSFDTYKDLDHSLRSLISDGKSETDEADAIRDIMDLHWYNLTDEQIAEIRNHGP